MMKSAQSKTTTLRRHSSQRTATDSQTRVTRLARRVGFTLVELLMVILIIGLLVAMLAVAINPALKTVYEGAVSVEMKQLEVAIENFKNDKGFYPPSFSGLTSAADLLPFLNKISPNHREGNGAVGTRLNAWWLAIGSKLDDRGSLIFWLNGLSKNKQFPITGGLANVDSGGSAVATGGNFQIPVIYGADFAIVVDANGELQRGEAEVVRMDNTGTIIGPAIERDLLYDFKGGQISSEFYSYNVIPNGLVTADPGIRVYNAPYGNEKFDLAFRYRNSRFYNLPGTATDMPVPGRSGDAFYVSTLDANGAPSQVFLNPRTFQLSTFGLDGRASAFAATAINKPPSGDSDQRKQWQEFNGDNITNFANGRLDSFDWTEAVDLGSKTAE